MLKTLTMTAALLVVSGGLAVAGGAAAQTTTPTPAASPQTGAALDPTADQIASWIAGRHGEVQGVDAEPAQDASQRDGKIHGVVGASIGSGGYRSGYGVATMPIGQRGDVTVGISDQHLGGGNRSYGGPPGLGYGYGGERRSLSIGVDLTGQGQGQRCNSADPGTHWGPPSIALDDPCRNRAPASQPER